MKKIFTLLVFCNGLLFMAKAQDSRSVYQQSSDSFFQYLDKSAIPTGILYDRVYPWSRLSQWANGDTTSVAHLFQSWFDAEQSVINPTV